MSLHVPAEPLEPRVLFSGGAPDIALSVPVRVTQVFVNGYRLANNAAFRAAAGVDATLGYPVPDGPNQLRPIAWFQGVKQLSIRFNLNVASVLDWGDLVVRDSFGAISTTAFDYDPATQTGTWTLGTTVMVDKLRLVLRESGFGSIGFDGAWNDGNDTYPSGNDTFRGDFNFRVNVLRGDANGDGTVNALDMAEAKKRVLRRPGDGVAGGNAYGIFADLNADGVINALDVAAARATLGTRLSTLPDPASLLS